MVSLQFRCFYGKKPDLPDNYYRKNIFMVEEGKSRENVVVEEFVNTTACQLVVVLCCSVFSFRVSTAFMSLCLQRRCRNVSVLCDLIAGYCDVCVQCQSCTVFNVRLGCVQFQCCGVNSWQDYNLTTNWTVRSSAVVPLTCCILDR